MTIYFGINNKDKRVVNKTIAFSTSKNCIIKDKTTILEPTFKLAYSIELVNYNYAFVPDLNRYYFLGNAIIGKDGTIEIPAKVDVLYSWMPYILNTFAVVKRQEYNYQPYIIDTEILTRCDKVQSIHNVGTIGLDNNLRYYLVTTGG